MTLITRTLEEIAASDVVQALFKEYDLSLAELFLVPIVFDPNLEVSARTEHAIIYLNDQLEKSVEVLAPYLVHELTHYCQQTTGKKPTQGADDGDYLDNPYEQEGFQHQTKYISETEGKDDAEHYIEKVLKHHDTPKSEYPERKKELLELAQRYNLLSKLG